MDFYLMSDYDLSKIANRYGVIYKRRPDTSCLEILGDMYRSVMVVDGCQFITESTKNILENKEVEVYGFTNPKKALDFLKENPEKTPECVITDYSMLGMNGLELIKQIRELKEGIHAAQI